MLLHPSEGLLNAVRSLRDRAAQELGESCTLSLDLADGSTVRLYADGAAVSVTPKGARVLRVAQGGADRTAPIGAR